VEEGRKGSAETMGSSGGDSASHSQGTIACKLLIINIYIDYLVDIRKSVQEVEGFE